MALSKFLKRLTSGRVQEESAIDSSAGAGDAGKIVGLDSSGKISQTMMPTGVGPDSEDIVASEALNAGDFVNIFDSGSGVRKMRKADATAAGKEADGFVKAAVANAATGTCFFEGTNDQLTGLTVGARYYLDKTTPGGVISDVSAYVAGNISMYIGKALSTTKVSFEPGEPITLA